MKGGRRDRVPLDINIAKVVGELLLEPDGNCSCVCRVSLSPLHCRKFFNRHFLCNSYVWTCSLTGQSHLTYTQAVESETEAQKLLDSFPQCYKRAVLELVHHVRRTNIRSLGDELLAFFKERYVVGERLELVQTTSSGAK